MGRHSVDLCIVGAGTAGYSAANAARELGKSVLLVDRPGELAGLCILRGCMPAKTVLEAAEVARTVDGASAFGIAAQRDDVDVSAIVKRKRHFVREFQRDRVADLETFALVRGSEVTFRSPRELTVDDENVEAHYFLVAAGSKVVPPAWPGLIESRYITSTQAMELESIPETLVVLGGGPVGCEFAQYFARLGARVTIVEEGPHLLRLEDPDVGDAVRAAFESEGLEVLTSTKIEGIRQSALGTRVTVRDGHGERTLRCETLMLATGRIPNMDGLSLEAAFVQSSDAGIQTDEYLRTTMSTIFAAGDVLGRRCLVHLAEYSGRLAVHNMFAARPVALDYDLYGCRSVYTHPEVAVAGLTEADCRKRKIPYKVARSAFAELGRARLANESDGFVKMIAADDGSILGITYVGDDAANLIQSAVALLYFRAAVADVGRMPHLHPTMGEILSEPADELRRALELPLEYGHETAREADGLPGSGAYL